MTDGGADAFTTQQRDLIDRVTAGAMARPVSERESYVRAECKDDSRVVREVLSLLAGVAESELTSFLSQAAQVPNDLTTRAGADAAESKGTAAGRMASVPARIDRYEIQELIGEGGFGSVYRAEQIEPVRRIVALKLIKPGMDTRQVIARFETERQALALMDHPNVARVLDAGATETGRPYFVMELVHGVPIHEFCDREKLGMRQRLRLFVQVCEAVQHAHQKGIIHRDIKPSNVIVTKQDGRSIPKVIDFGIAKATDQQHAEQTMFTEQGQFIGTPAYMSPEQADTTLDDIDTRSDIYSLGVMLYELLTGMMPFDHKRLRSAAYHEIQRIIREEEPPRPSTRLSSSGDDVAAIATCRRANPQQLVKSVRGDLDWIIMKAMEKDRSRRYETANGFALDIERFLAEEPVSASPPSAAYRLRKLVRRNKGLCASVAMIAITLVLGIAGTSIGMVMARHERDRANDAAATAERKAQTAERISDFLVGLFEASDPSEAQGIEVSAQELLDIGAARIQALDEEPEVKIELQETIGWIFMVLGRISDARPLLEDALKYRESHADGNEADLAKSLHIVANLHDLAGDYKLAEPLAERSVKIRERLFGDSIELAQSLNTLGNVLWHENRLDEAAELHRQALEIRERILPPNHEDIAQSLHNLGALRYFANDLPEAERLYKQAIEIELAIGGENNHSLATSMHVLAIVYQDQGKYAEAIELENKSLAVKRRVLGENHPYVALGLTTLGNIQRLSNRPELAEPNIRAAVEMAEAVWGKNYGEVWWMRRSLATTLVALDRTDDAMAELEDLIKTIEEADNPGSLPSNLNSMGRIHLDAGRLAEAESLYRRSLSISSNDKEPGESGDAYAIAGLARTMHQSGNLDEAESLFARAINVIESHGDTEDSDSLRIRGEFAELLRDRGKEQAATIQAERVLAFHRGVAIPSTARPHELSAAALAFLRPPRIELRDTALALEFSARAVEHTNRENPVYLARLAEALFASGQAKKAIETQTEAIRLLAEDSPRRAGFESALQGFSARTQD